MTMTENAATYLGYPATLKDFAEVRAPIGLARTLPPAAYTSRDAFLIERSRVFHKGWRAIAFSDQIPNPGDACPIDYVGAQLLAVRQSNGSIRVFHNLVIYDGCPVLLDPIEAASELTSAYHGFVFGLDGILQRAPFWNGDPEATASAIENEKRNLIELPCREWGRMIFADFSSSGEPAFNDMVAPLQKEFGDIAFNTLAPGRENDGALTRSEIIAGGNWKTHHENACINVYHEASVHEIYRVSVAIPRLENGERTYREVCDKGLRGLAYTDAAAGDTYMQLPFPPLTRTNTTHEGNAIVSLYPNVYVSVIGEHIHLTLATPVDAENTQIQSISLYDRSVAANPDTYEVRCIIEAAWAESGAEDNRVINAIQRARHSPVAQAGFFAPFWDRMHHDFLNQLLDDIEELSS
jgi:choline monooxygenase